MAEAGTEMERVAPTAEVTAAQMAVAAQTAVFTAAEAGTAMARVTPTDEVTVAQTAAALAD